MQTRRFLLALWAAVSALALPNALAQTPAPGYETASAPALGGLIRALSNGDFLRFDGARLERYDANSVLLALLHQFDPQVYTGAFLVAPDESYVLLGESTNGEFYRYDLPSGPLVYLTNIPFNYDAAIAPNGAIVVSAATLGWGQNQLVRIDPKTGSTTEIGSVPGPSGPVAFDSRGWLWYATQSNTFPSPLGAVDLLVWLDNQVAVGGLSESNALVYAVGFDGGSSLAIDPRTDSVFLAEANFSLGYPSRIRRVTQVGFTSPTVFTAPAGAWLTVAPFRAGSGPGEFAPFQPAASGSIQVEWNDFAGTTGATFVRPKRPLAQFAGPGTAGAGEVDFEIAQAPALGSAILLFAPTTSLLGAEYAFPVAFAPPVLTEIAPFAITVLPGLLPLDLDGSASLGFYNPGNLNGWLVGQALLLDANQQVVGTSTLASL